MSASRLCHSSRLNKGKQTIKEISGPFQRVKKAVEYLGNGNTNHNLCI